MDHINSLFGHTTKRLQAPPDRSRSSERGDLMQYFLDQLNPRRTAAGFPPLDFPRLGRELKGLSVHQLYHLKGICDSSNNWSATFWTTLKTDKYPKKV